MQRHTLPYTTYFMSGHQSNQKLLPPFNSMVVHMKARSVGHHIGPGPPFQTMLHDTKPTVLNCSTLMKN